MNFRNILITVLTISFLLFVGCQKKDDSQARTDQEYTQSQKEQMVQEAESELEEMEKKGEQLKKDLGSQESEAFASQWDQMIGDAKTQLNKLGTYTAEGWASVFTGFQETMNSLNEIYQKNKLLLSDKEMKIPEN